MGYIIPVLTGRFLTELFPRHVVSLTRWFPDRPSLICIINAVVACRVALYIMCTDYRATAVDTRARNWGDMPLQCRLRLPLSVHCYTDLVGCWRGYLPGVRCRLVYGPADAIATHCLLLQYNPDWFTFLVPAYPGSPGQRAVKRVCVCVCIYRLAFYTQQKVSLKSEQ